MPFISKLSVVSMFVINFVFLLCILRNDLNMLEMPSICGKRLKYVGNGIDIWETA